MAPMLLTDWHRLAKDSLCWEVRELAEAMIAAKVRLAHRLTPAPAPVELREVA